MHKGLTPTRVGGAIECMRRWAFVELFGADDPGNYYSDWGTAFHRVAENWYRHGTEPPDTDQGRSFAASITYVPDRGDHIVVEKTLEFESIQGTLDLHYVEGDTVHVFDWKSIGNVKNKKSKNALLKHPQAPIYALMAMKYYGLKQCQLHWRYFSREEPYECGVVDIVSDWDELYSIYLEKFEPTVKKMIAMQIGFVIEQYPKAENKNACWAIRDGPGAPAQRCHQELACKQAEMRKEMGTATDDSGFFADLLGGTPKHVEINPPEKTAPAPKIKKTRKPKKSTTQEPKKGYDYYRNCIPVRGVQYTDVSELLEPLMVEVAAAAKKPYWSLAEYGSGKALLAQAVKQAIADGLFNGKTIVARGHSDEVTCTMHEFMLHATVVVVGVT